MSDPAVTEDSPQGAGNDALVGFMSSFLAASLNALLPADLELDDRYLASVGILFLLGVLWAMLGRPRSSTFTPLALGGSVGGLGVFLCTALIGFPVFSDFLWGRLKEMGSGLQVALHLAQWLAGSTLGPALTLYAAWTVAQVLRRYGEHVREG